MHGASFVRAACLQTAAAPGVPAAPEAAASPPQTQADEYTRYELLAPGSARIRLDFVNPRPDEIAVLIKARRRGGR
jgi:hypothetical protein